MTVNEHEGWSSAMTAEGMNTGQRHTVKETQRNTILEITVLLIHII